MRTPEEIRAERDELHAAIEPLKAKLKALSAELLEAEYIDEDTKAAMKRAARRGLVMRADPATLRLKGRKK